MDWDGIFTTRILPELGAKRGGVLSPRFVFVCGQPGAGKTTTVNRLLDQLGRDQTQLISIDTVTDLLHEVFGDCAGSKAATQEETFKTKAQLAYVNALFDHASALRAHVIWERPFPTDTLSFGLAARALGYRAECLVIAVPADESWLWVLTRETTRSGEPGRAPARVGWDRLLESHDGWPALIGQAEDLHAFDEIRILNRDGETLFENRLVPDAVSPRWENPAFAFESLVVERLQPRSPAQLDALIAAWQDLCAHPDLAFRNHAAWPWASLAALGERLRARRADPSTGFDLNDPTSHQDPCAAAGWIARLEADLAAVLASPEAKGLKTLAPRADRLLTLVRQLSAQPIR